MRNNDNADINERVGEVLSKYGIALICDDQTMVSKLIRGNQTVGELDYTTDVASGARKMVINFEDAGLFYIAEGGSDMEADLAYLEDKLPEMFVGGGLKVKVQYLNDRVKRLSMNAKGDWVDMYAAETVELKQGEHKLIHLGVAMKLPEGYEAHLVPRSSTFKKWGIIQANHVGIIDNSYSGPEDWWKMSVIAMRDTVINKDDKICQFRIVERQPKLSFVEGKMEGESRGGFGSTGSK
jgi:dUTP pyrophosphatase